MTPKQLVTCVGIVAGIGGFVLAGSISAPLLRAADEDHDEARIKVGLKIAPVTLNFEKKNRKLVGLGSYLVNGAGDCNGCHSAGPETQYTSDGNPYLLFPVFAGKKKVNPDTYLGGGFDFGEFPGPGGPHIITRNLTPDHSGLPEGGATFAEFQEIMRTGVDEDHIHPNCPGLNCLPFPFNGSLLQIMPWPAFQDMTDHDLRAIYEYISAVPCIPGGPLPGHVC